MNLKWRYFHHSFSPSSPPTSVDLCTYQCALPWRRNHAFHFALIHKPKDTTVPSTNYQLAGLDHSRDLAAAVCSGLLRFRARQ